MGDIRRARAVLILGALLLTSATTAHATTLVYVVNEKWILVAGDRYGMRNGQPETTGFDKIHLFGNRGFLTHHGYRSFESRAGRYYTISEIIRWYTGVNRQKDYPAEMGCKSLGELAEYDHDRTASENARALVDALAPCWKPEFSATFDVLSFERADENAPYHPTACTIDLPPEVKKTVPAPAICEEIDSSPGPVAKPLTEHWDHRYQSVLVTATDHLIYRALRGLDKNLIDQSVVIDEKKFRKRNSLGDHDYAYRARVFRDVITDPQGYMKSRNCQDLGPDDLESTIGGLEVGLEYHELAPADAATLACRLLRFQLDMSEYRTQTYLGRLLDQGYEDVTWPASVEPQMHWGFAKVDESGMTVVDGPEIRQIRRTDSCEGFFEESRE